MQGLVELIVLNIGKDAGIIDNTCFGMLVLMALITYVMLIEHGAAAANKLPCPCVAPLLCC
jgi:hypothetical protein